MPPLDWPVGKIYWGAFLIDDFWGRDRSSVDGLGYGQVAWGGTKKAAERAPEVQTREVHFSTTYASVPALAFPP